MNNPRIAISTPALGEDEWLAVREPIMSGWLTQGPKVAAFEKAFAERHQVRHALAVTSCTTGLHLALAALGIQPGDEVIVPAFTWISTANVVLYCGAKPIFADVDPATFNLSPDSVAKAITPRTKAVIAVHLFGRCADMNALRQVIPDQVPIIEDCACAAGASYRGTPAGGLGLMGVFSFHPRKSITTGEGGMVTTNDSSLAERLNQMRNHGASISEEQRHAGPQPYLLPEFNLLGFNYRMTDLQGAVGLVQLAKLDEFIAYRAELADIYRKELGALNWLSLPQTPDGYSHAWQAYVTLLDPATAPLPRNEIMRRLEEAGISTRPGTHAVHMLGLYRDKFGIKPEDFPGARQCNDQSMAIPLHNRMTAEDCRRIAQAIQNLG